uniref:Receptor L-domain domain-containing protein n=1 Tax=Panagrolaimus sp. JU765 TaxID=591449 RepID=A0AC34QA87_9BILA
MLLGDAVTAKFGDLLFYAENVYAGFISSIIPLKLSKRGNEVNLVLRQVIVGNLILDNIPGDLWQNGRTVQPWIVYEVTGYVHLKNINFNLDLRNLAVIHGEELEPETGAALLIEDSDMQYFDVPMLQVIKHGKVVIRNCKNLCYWNPNEKNGVDYERLVRPEPNSKTKDEINSRISILNSFGNCGGELSSCGNNQRCFWRNILQIP